MEQIAKPTELQEFQNLLKQKMSLSEVAKKMGSNYMVAQIQLAEWAKKYRASR